MLDGAESLECADLDGLAAGGALRFLRTRGVVPKGRGRLYRLGMISAQFGGWGYGMAYAAAQVVETRKADCRTIRAVNMVGN